MKKRNACWILAACLLLLAGLGVSVWWPGANPDLASAQPANRPPHIRPDYTDTVIPPNLAPLNFLVAEPGTRYRVRIRSEQGKAIDVASRTPRIVIPLSRWQQLLSVNRGQKLYFDICVRRADGQWTRYEPIINTIAEADIDNYLCYRLIKPIYILRADVNIYQRDLRNFDETTVASNRSFEGGCINCHTFDPNHPDRMILHSRGDDKAEWNGMIVVHDGKVTKVDTRALVRTAEFDRGRIKQAMAAYASWHPNGRLVAYSANDISQFFHAVGENRDVYDRESDLALYHVDSNTVTTTPNISQPDRLETFPNWSPDGRYLYFCSAVPLPATRHKEVRYDLMRIRYEADSGRWGEVEPVLLARDTGLSITEPRVSPDGRWVLICMSAYGSFPAFQPSSDLYLIDLKTRQHHQLEANSPRCESWHSWSSNSRWIAFASKREDGVFSRLYLSYIDEGGHAHKAVMLPQKDPTFYDRLIKTYNVPELARNPVPAPARALAREIRSGPHTGGTKPDAEPGMKMMNDR